MADDVEHLAPKKKRKPSKSKKKLDKKASPVSKIDDLVVERSFPKSEFVLGDEIGEVLPPAKEKPVQHLQIIKDLAESLGGPNPGRKSEDLEKQMLPMLAEAADFLSDEDPYNLTKLTMARSLSPKLIRDVATKIELGCNIKTICDLLLINYQSLLRWRLRGETLLTKLDDEKDNLTFESKHDQLCAQFVLALRKASGRYLGRLDYDIHCGTNFSRALAIAERRNPNVYGKNNTNGQIEYHIDETFV